MNLDNSINISCYEQISLDWIIPFRQLRYKANEKFIIMDNQVVFITGGADGIGFGIAKRFAQDRAIIVLCDKDKRKLFGSTDLLRGHGIETMPIKCDVTKAGQLESAIEGAHTTYGRIDVLINNAGVQYIAPIESFPKEKFEYLIAVMLIAPFVAIKHAFPIMKKQNFGRIINVSSINGLIGFAGKAAYNSAKHGLIGLTKVAALEAAEYDITVNAICPGYVDTTLVRDQLSDLSRIRKISIEKVLEEIIYPLVPQKRLLSIEEIADYVVFLSKIDAKGITGQAIVIDGGYTAQ